MMPLHPEVDPAAPDDAACAAPAGRRATGVRAPAGTDLRDVLKMIASSTDARDELVADLRDQVTSDTYLSEEKLNLAIYRLLKDILD